MRKPIYGHNNPDARIISVPGGLWRVQVRGEAKGTREHDPWAMQSHPIPKPEAMKALGSYAKGGHNAIH